MKTISQLFFKDRASGEAAADVVKVSVDKLGTNPFQPRKTFSEAGLQELCASIREFGVIQPLLVRKTPAGFELIAGERRLRASIMLGLAEVPCIVREADDREMAEIALIENLQREDLHFMEEAAGYDQLLSKFDLTQDELARRVGKDQSTVANKLRLLKLEAAVRERIVEAGLTERHARALLKIPGEELRIRIIEEIVVQQLNVRDTETLVDIAGRGEVPEGAPKARPRRLQIVKDARIFINTIGELVKQMKTAGLAVKLTQVQSDDAITITMVVPKKR